MTKMRLLRGERKGAERLAAMPPGFTGGRPGYVCGTAGSALKAYRSVPPVT